MADVLYRKYRSQTFDSLIGQEHITRILKNAVKTSSLSHAYLFVGSRGTGKTSTARILAKAINCHELTKDGNPCNKCSSCMSITSGTFLDLIEIDAASNRGIDQIRELKERLEFSPAEGKYKIYIIDEVHMLTTEAFNALLKTLEEPPPHVIFMLATTDVHKLPATILSRCQRYDFRLGNDKEIEELVSGVAKDEGVTLSEGALKVLVANARGSYRDSLSLLDVVVSGQMKSDKPDEVSENEVRQILGVPDSTMVYYLLENLVARNSDKALNLIDELDSKGVDLQQFVRYVLNALRLILVDKLRGTEESSEFSFIKQIGRREIIRMINLFLDADRKLRTAYIPKLVVEVVIAEICFDTDLTNEAASQGMKPASTPSTPPKSDTEKKGKIEKVKGKAKEGETAKSDLGTTVSHSDKGETSSVIKVIKQAEASSSEDIQLTDSDTEVIKEAEASSPDDMQLTDGSNPTVISSKEIEEKWSELVQKLQDYNGHLYAFLKAGKLLGIEKGTISIEVPFEFHKDRIESPKSREIISGAITEVYGSVISYKCVVNESAQNKKPVAADVILKNIPRPEQATPQKKSEASSDGQKKQDWEKKPRTVNKKIEAIFADV